MIEPIARRAVSCTGIGEAHDDNRVPLTNGQTRRAFMLRAAAALGISAFGTGCRRRSRPAEEVAARDEPATEPIAFPPEPTPEPPPTRPPLPAEEPIVRVRIVRFRPSTEADVANMQETQSGDRPLLIGEPGQRLRLVQHTPTPQVSFAEGPLAVFIDRNGWAVIDATFFRAFLTGIDPVEIHHEDSASSSEHSIAIEGRRYGGSLRLVSRSDIGPTAFDIVNHIALESYLPGVLARELYNHWHLQTHAAQAIAARSFAISEHAYFLDRRHFDMTNTQASQAYIGAVTHETSLEAVAITRGHVLAEDDLIVPGYYSSCCGGRAARAIDVIGPNPINDTPALHGRAGECACAGSPHADWTVERASHEVMRRLIAFGNANNHPHLPNLSPIELIEVAQENAHGRPTSYLIKDIRNLEIILPAETLRRALNYAGQGLHPPTRAASIRSGFFEATVRRNTIAFSGHGYGHGAGLCQYGAQALAQDGLQYEDILAFFYPTATVTRAYT